MLAYGSAESDIYQESLVPLMASKTGANQAVEANDEMSLASHISKESKLKPVPPENLSVSGQINVKPNSIQVNPKKNSSSDSLARKADSSISFPSVENLSIVDSAKSSLIISADNEKKMSEHGSVKSSSVSATASDGTSSLAKTSGSAMISDRHEFVGSGKSSMCRGSTSTDVSDDSTSTSFSASNNKPHKTNDSRWEAIQVVRAKDGALGLSHFRLLKRLGCGDIGSVYLAELSGTKSYFAMKVMDKASLASRKKLLRAQTEREILQSLDHPFLPTLYTHFETDKFSCLVMEFCPGGDLHTLRQRQQGKHFSELAVK